MAEVNEEHVRSAADVTALQMAIAVLESRHPFRRLVPGDSVQKAVILLIREIEQIRRGR